MSDETFQFGDKVLHNARPEWGAGSVVKVEEAIINGERAQRLSIRFPNAGLKCLIAGKSSGAELKKVKEEDNGHATSLNGLSGVAPSGTSRLEQWEQMSRTEWLSPLAQRKIKEVMTSVPEECTDAFIPLPKRLANTLRLYKYDKSGKGLIDWAVSQSGLNDPLTRFTRTELEQLFDRWGTLRDLHLAKLLDAGREETAMLREVLQAAPPAAVQHVRKHFATSR